MHWTVMWQLHFLYDYLYLKHNYKVLGAIGSLIGHLIYMEFVFTPSMGDALAAVQRHNFHGFKHV